ncbi:MAG: GNAT family N-acetyltransferase [Candidatus Woesearchaeota archaeon]|jgi:ribosomal protein S18 acetylase RimI-like enzyme
MNKKIQTIIINNHIFILRNAEDKDYNFVYNLLKENMLESFIKNWGSWNEKSFEENYHKENIQIIEYQNASENSSIGYIDFKFKKDCGYINNIQLISKIRGIGLGTQIMKLLEQETTNHGLNKIRLKVFKDNLALNLYKKLNYNPIFEDDTSLIMEKNI